MISGILAVDKPAGWTSHDVVARVRRVAGQKQVGHAGTLDPLATGVLLLVLGDATRLSSYLMESTKVYCAAVVLGASTVTDDAEAPLAERCDLGNLTRARIEECLAAFTGVIRQTPPAYAAVRHAGEKLYALARRGETVQPAARTVRVDAIDLLSWDPPQARLRVRCGPGTYLRALARDLGAALGVGGYLHALRRTSSGGFSLRDCVALDALRDAAQILPCLQPPDRAVAHLPALVLDDAGADRVRNGRPVGLGGAASGTVRLYGPTGSMIGLGTVDGTTVRPFRVFLGAQGADARRHSR